MKKNKLIVDNARNMHKSITFILGALLAIVSFLEMNQGMITGILSNILSPEQFSVVTFVLGLLIVIGKYIKQPSLNK